MLRNGLGKEIIIELKKRISESKRKKTRVKNHTFMEKDSRDRKHRECKIEYISKCSFPHKIRGLNFIETSSLIWLYPLAMEIKSNKQFFGKL